jgi:hypothetical protein
MITITKKQSIIAVMAVFAAVMFAGPVAIGLSANQASAWGGGDDFFFHHHHHHHFFFFHHFHHDWD